MILFRLLPIVFALLFILVQRVNVKVVMRERLTVKINFNIIALVLYETDAKRSALKDYFSLLKNIRGMLSAFKRLLTKSVVSVKLFRKKTSLDDYPSIIGYVSSTAIERVILSYLCVNSKRFLFFEELYESEIDPEKGKTFFDAIFYFSLANLINSVLILLYYIIKNKAKRVIKNV